MCKKRSDVNTFWMHCVLPKVMTVLLEMLNERRISDTQRAPKTARAPLAPVFFSRGVFNTHSLYLYAPIFQFICLSLCQALHHIFFNDMSYPLLIHYFNLH